MEASGLHVPQAHRLARDLLGPSFLGIDAVERFLSPVEFCLAAMLYQQVTGLQLCFGNAVRFPVPTAEGRWVRVRWSSDRLTLCPWDGESYGHMGTASARF